MRYFFLTLCTVLFALTPPAVAAQGTPPSVKAAEQYLQTLDTAQARFIQTAQDGSQFIGTFYLDRPGKLRFEYDDPIEDFVVADGFFIFFYDAQLGEQSNAPIGQTLADFLLRDDVRLDGDVTVTDIKRGGDLLHITLIQTNDPGAGSLTLGFEENPMKLKKWRVLDAVGNITEVELFQLREGLRLDDTLFVYRDPKTTDPYTRND